MGVLVKVFKKQKQKVVFVWYLGWDGDGGAHKTVRKKKKYIDTMLFAIIGRYKP